jgi:hypothetical protein
VNVTRREILEFIFVKPYNFEVFITCSLLPAFYVHIKSGKELLFVLF